MMSLILTGHDPGLHSVVYEVIDCYSVSKMHRFLHAKYAHKLQLGLNESCEHLIQLLIFLIHLLVLIDGDDKLVCFFHRQLTLCKSHCLKSGLREPLVDRGKFLLVLTREHTHVGLQATLDENRAFFFSLSSLSADCNKLALFRPLI